MHTNYVISYITITLPQTVSHILACKLCEADLIAFIVTYVDLVSSGNFNYRFESGVVFSC